ncbi:2-C-methyl-D-erythritol 4-phosphate cytidylyltransferase, partial [Turicibacter sanguinis]|nr:2-C-methyl-D-erythritol 4-phosphate cytidylyltransferase [Turicibacter sanguinis]
MNIVVILSGGVGSRMKMSRPKQYILVNNKPVFLYSFLQFCHRTDIDAFVIVVAPEWEEFIQKT